MRGWEEKYIRNIGCFKKHLCDAHIIEDDHFNESLSKKKLSFALVVLRTESKLLEQTR